MATFFQFPGNNINRDKESGGAVLDRKSDDSKESKPGKEVVGNISSIKKPSVPGSDEKGGGGNEIRRKNVIETLGKMWPAALTTLPKNEFVRLKMLESLIDGLEGGYSRKAYVENFTTLRNNELSDLLPILNGMSDEEFSSRPAYAYALINNIKQKDMLLALEAKKEKFD